MKRGGNVLGDENDGEGEHEHQHEERDLQELRQRLDDGGEGAAQHGQLGEHLEEVPANTTTQQRQSQLIN